MEFFHPLERSSVAVDFQTKSGARTLLVEADIDPDAALFVMLPADLADHLGLRRAGPVSLSVCGRRMTADCMIGPLDSRPMIGSLVLSALDLVVDQETGAVTRKPEAPPAWS
jgi:hypothetical protein